MTSDLELLHEYARQGSEEAFAALVHRHLHLVYSAAMRQVRSRPLAEEVAQSVFADLARNAARLKPDTILTAWLYQVTRRTAIDVVRRESRRQVRERIALEMTEMNSNSAEWTQVEPLLDEAMEALEETDRSAILLRYFENNSLRDVGQSLGTSEDAAQKRVSRAVERLREFFAQRGVTVGASGLVIVITANAVQAAPAGLAATISTAAALTGTAFQTTTAIAATKTIAMTTLPKTLVAVVIAASLSMPVLVQYRAQARLREIEEVSLQRAERLAELRAENEGFSNLLAQAKTAQPPVNEQFNELLKLRGEVGRLQAAVQELTGPKTNEPLSREEVLDSMRQLYLNRVNRLKQFFAANPAEAVPELQYLTDKDWLELVTYDHHRLDPDGRYALSSARSKAQISFAKSVLDAALRQYGRNNNGQFPTDLPQLVPYFKSPVDPSVLEHWAILPTSSLPSTMRVDEPWVITQRAPVDAARDERIVIGMKNSQLGRRSTNDWIRTE